MENIFKVSYKIINGKDEWPIKTREVSHPSTNPELAVRKYHDQNRHASGLRSDYKVNVVSSKIIGWGSEL